MTVLRTGRPSVVPVVVPQRLDGDDGREFLAMADIFNTALHHDLGLDHLRWDAAEMLPAWQDQTDRVQAGFLAWQDEVPVGALQLTAPREDGATELEFDLLALPDARDGAVEDALLARVLDEAEGLGRTHVQTYTLHRADAAGERMPSPTGFGSVPVDRYSRFYRDHGFTLQQVERNSILDLTAPLDRVGELLTAAEAAAGPEYRLLTWTSPTPARWRDEFAHVISRMSTDAPFAGLTVTEETWDAERVTRRDERLGAGGVLVSVAVIEHLPTGRLVAYNELTIGADRTRPTNQWGTLVLREHRGHRLGTLVKCANILRWRELVPQSPMITTFNAEENRPMLDVNEALGFTPLTVAGAWQRVS
ncbi:GNAT family N-acetyltransferase [uncultured Microbacterium sp.]|uniref:Histone acetyltransferase HPA2 n=1 Tax=uncultured Microbacterium sp. TaxID=191216 RepID=A0A1Y5NZS9_9MICO|nr:GNAT family N-acetyltransferase [uncultured Microbacterium sp.]SBS70599.1 Histone acetyltransferase HPA2 [uncultured Microbacterium sp.]